MSQWCALLWALLRFFMDDRDRARLLLRETLDHPEELRATLQEHLQPWMRLLTEALRTGQASGALRAEVHPEAYIHLIITSAVGLAAAGDNTAAVLTPEPSREAQLTELVRIARVALLSPLS